MIQNPSLEPGSIGSPMDWVVASAASHGAQRAPDGWRTIESESLLINNTVLGCGVAELVLSHTPWNPILYVRFNYSVPPKLTVTALDTRKIV